MNLKMRKSLEIKQRILRFIATIAVLPILAILGLCRVADLGSSLFSVELEEPNPKSETFFHFQTSP